MSEWREREVHVSFDTSRRMPRRQVPRRQGPLKPAPLRLTDFFVEMWTATGRPEISIPSKGQAMRYFGARLNAGMAEATLRREIEDFVAAVVADEVRLKPGQPALLRLTGWISGHRSG